MKKATMRARKADQPFWWSKLKPSLGHVTPLRVLVVLFLVASLFVFSSNPQKPQARSVATDSKTTNTQVLGVSSEPTITADVAASEEVIPSGVRVPILFYHYIEVNPNPKGDPGRDKLLVTPTNFESQLQYFKSQGFTTITLDQLLVGIKDPKTLPAKPIILSFDDGYTDFYYQAFPLLQKYEMRATIYVLSRGAQIGPGFYMSNDQIRELSASPLITVACHTQDHKSLKNKSESFQRQEIFGCKSELTTIIGKPVTHFAYPYGDFDATSIRLVKEAGFLDAASTMISAYNSANDLYSLHRIRMGNWPGTSKYFQDLVNMNK